MKTSVSVGDIRLLNVKVILNDTQTIYEGAAENAPAEIKKMRYDKIQPGSIMNLYVYNNNS